MYGDASADCLGFEAVIYTRTGEWIDEESWK